MAKRGSHKGTGSESTTRAAAVGSWAARAAELDVLRGAARQARIEGQYRVPAHLEAAALRCVAAGEAEWAPWAGAGAPQGGRALRCTAAGAAAAERAPAEVDDGWRALAAQVPR